MTNDYNDYWLSVYEQARARLVAQLEEADQLIAKRKAELNMGTETPLATSPLEVGPHDFVGLKPGDAVLKYLKQRGGKAVHATRIQVDIVSGGGKIKNVKTACHSGLYRELIHYDDKTRMVSLVENPVTPKPPGRARGPKP